jgi:hypothetical protein
MQFEANLIDDATAIGGSKKKKKKKVKKVKKLDEDYDDDVMD